MTDTTPQPASPSKPQTGMWVGIGIIVVVIIAALLLFGGDNDDAVETATEERASDTSDAANTSEEAVTSEVVDESEPVVQGAVKEFTVQGDNFSFSLDEMRVSQGDTVRVTFVNDEGNHDWRVDEFNAATAIIKSGEQETIEFVADQAGTFEYYCSVGQHRQLGMKGNLIVE